MINYSTDNKKFGSSALYFPGANPDYLTMPDKTLPYFNDADWTIEAWIWFEKSSTGTLISKTASSTYGQIRIDISNVGLITCYMSYNDSSNFYVNNDGNPIDNPTSNNNLNKIKNEINLIKDDVKSYNEECKIGINELIEDSKRLENKLNTLINSSTIKSSSRKT